MSTQHSTGPRDDAPAAPASTTSWVRLPLTGWAFVVLLLISAGMADVPDRTVPTAAARAFYQHTTGILLAQILAVAAAFCFAMFATALARRLHARRVAATGSFVAAAAVLTSIPVAVLAVAHDVPDSALHTLVAACDATDVLLFLSIAAFAGAVARSTTSSVWRTLSGACAVVSLARALLLALGSSQLAIIAPLSFLLLVAALTAMGRRRFSFGHAQRPDRVDGERQPASAVPQYGAGSILAVWAAAALPMAAAAWLLAPALAPHLGGKAPLVAALLLSLTAGLVWQMVLVLLLVLREQGNIRWATLRSALWLRAPRSPRTGRAGGRVWVALVPFIVLFAAEQLVPSLPVPAGRDLATFLESGTGNAFFHGSWGWFVLVVVMGVFNTVLGEELLFRGFLLPRMQGRFGRADWLANGVLFALYHLHTPWVIPSALIDSLCLALPTKRYRSAWMGIAVHSTQTVFISVGLLAVVS